MATTALYAPNFIHEDFLLEKKFSQRLHDGFAAQMPIIDFRCHLPIKEIASDSIFENLTKNWRNGDQYKCWAMRTFGIKEENITGRATDKEKFMARTKTVPYTLRNPFFHWTHLELTRFFNIETPLNSQTGNQVYDGVNAKLRTKAFSPQDLIKKMNVEVDCTTEDPIDELSHHQKIEKYSTGFTVSTSFRPDKANLISNKDYLLYIDTLAAVAGGHIDSYRSLCDALCKRLGHFHNTGCRLSDHGLDYVRFGGFSDSEVENICRKRRAGKVLPLEENEKFQTAILIFFCEQYRPRSWAQRFHLGVLRNNNSRMTSLLGLDTGWDSIGNHALASSFSYLWNALDSKDKLAKTILHNLHPFYNEVMATMIGNFNDGSVKGKMQLGSSWWFMDQKDGMTRQNNALSNLGLLSYFSGMLKDWRSFLSYPRHEYFRRILCNLSDKELQKGELPTDVDWVVKII